MRRGLIPLMAALLLAAAVSSAAFGGETLKLATGEWAPYSSEKMAEKGVVTEIISHVLKVMEVEPEYIFYPWERCYQAVRTGKVWGAFPYARTEERAGEVLFSDVIIPSTAKLFYFRGADDPPREPVDALSDLKALRLGGIRGYYYESVLTDAGLRVEYSSNPLSVLEKLRLGRIDLFVSNELVGWHLIQRHFPDEIDRFGTLPTPLDRHGLHLIVSTEYPGARKLLDRFNEALAEVKDVYLYRRIVRKLDEYGRETK